MEPTVVEDQSNGFNKALAQLMAAFGEGDTDAVCDLLDARRRERALGHVERIKEIRDGQ